jgi:hypothetical protein
MKKIKIALFAVLGCFAASGHAMDGVFDRSTEVAKYVEMFKSGPRGALVDASKEIYTSGINDPVLAAAVKDRLLADYKTIKMGDSAGSAYLSWGTKALASFGIAEHASALGEICAHASSQKARGHCKDELERIDWHRGKNQIMASRKNYVDGENPRTARYINLIQADDFSYKYLGADRINWERLLEPRVMDAIAEQIELNLDKTTTSADRATTKTMGMFCKLLGYSGQMKHKETLQKVIDSDAGMLVTKHAKEALAKFK